jgi:hypothetical protein
LKLYSEDTDASANGHAPPIDVEEPDEDEFDGSEHDYSKLFDAPSYSDFIKTAPNSTARSYERRVQSMMKAGMVASLNNQNWADAATFLKHGPGFAKAAGNLAAEDARARGILDMLTAPDSAYVMFFMVGIPLVAQLARNHQPDFDKAGETFRERRVERKRRKIAGEKPHTSTPPITIHIFKREVKLPIRLRIKLPNLKNSFKAFLAPTQHPNAIASEVFNDPAVVKSLHKMGIYPHEAPDGD